MATYVVYILRCSDDSFYTGITNDVELRVQQHQEGIDSKCYTFKRRPVTLVHRAEFSEVTDAIAFEKKVKRWSRRKKEALINKEYEKLPELSAMKGDWLIANVVRSARFRVMVSLSNQYGNACRPSTGSG